MSAAGRSREGKASALALYLQYNRREFSAFKSADREGNVDVDKVEGGPSAAFHDDDYRSGLSAEPDLEKPEKGLTSQSKGKIRTWPPLTSQLYLERVPAARFAIFLAGAAGRSAPLALFPFSIAAFCIRAGTSLPETLSEDVALRPHVGGPREERHELRQREVGRCRRGRSWRRLARGHRAS